MPWLTHSKLSRKFTSAALNVLYSTSKSTWIPSEFSAWRPWRLSCLARRSIFRRFTTAWKFTTCWIWINVTPTLTPIWADKIWVSESCIGCHKERDTVELISWNPGLKKISKKIKIDSEWQTSFIAWKIFAEMVYS